MHGPLCEMLACPQKLIMYTSIFPKKFWLYDTLRICNIFILTPYNSATAVIGSMVIGY